jgi:hypothetical protein
MHSEIAICTQPTKPAFKCKCIGKREKQKSFVYIVLHVQHYPRVFSTLLLLFTILVLFFFIIILHTYLSDENKNGKKTKIKTTKFSLFTIKKKQRANAFVIFFSFASIV